MTGAPVQLSIFDGRQRAASRHEPEIQRLVPLMQQLALEKGEYGVTVGELRYAATVRGLLEPAPKDRRLSWLHAVPRAAGLVRTDRRRIDPSSRNDHLVYVAKGTR